jgi:hypothetical protein
MRRIAAALVTLCLLAPAASAEDGLAGEWSGEGFQVGPGGYQSQWTIRLEFRNARTADVAYPSLGCTGELKLLKGDRQQAEYRETITSGTCFNGGRVIMRRVGDRVMWFWFGEPDTGVDASAVLYPSDLVS